MNNGKDTPRLFEMILPQAGLSGAEEPVRFTLQGARSRVTAASMFTTGLGEDR